MAEKKSRTSLPGLFISKMMNLHLEVLSCNLEETLRMVTDRTNLRG